MTFVVAVEADRALEEARAAGAALVWKDLAVGQAGAVVDGGVDVLVADTGARSGACVSVLAAVRAPAAAITQPAQFLDVEVHELTGPRALVAADHASGRAIHPCQAGRCRDGASTQCTVDGATPSS